MTNKLITKENFEEISPEELDQINGGSIKDIIDVFVKIIRPNDNEKRG